MAKFKYTIVREAEIWITANNALLAQKALKQFLKETPYSEFKWEETCLLQSVMDIGDAESIELPSGDVRNLKEKE